MPKIIELDQHVADLIAAGEVVTRPSSAVKELLENSIDAGAKIITVEISSGGMTYIRVTDDGCGMAPEDAQTAFLRHATSKLRDAQGLEAIGTLGFRGEALAAIAAVSRIELLTREQGVDEGTSLKLDAGTIVDMSPVGCPEGTTIIVRDLFFNTPARLKFMKSDRAEASSIASVVLRCALSRPDISIRFIKDGKTEYHTPGDSRIDSCIYSLLGREIEAGFIRAESADENVAVEGFVSLPESARGNRSYQFFFVNGRVVRSLLLQSAIEQAYKNRLQVGRFPSCVLYITTKNSNVDVNVHPAKTEIKFISDKQVFDGVYYAALGALARSQNESLSENSAIKMPQETSSSASFIAGTSTDTLGYKAPSSHKSSGKGGGFKTMQADEFRNSHISEYASEYTRSFRSQGERSNRPSSSPESYIKQSASASTAEGSPTANVFTKNTINKHLESSVAETLTHDSFRVIGEALNVYIIVEHNESVWFIDKHAAHERIHFDALRSGAFTPMSESLLTPVICRVGLEDASFLLENVAFLETLGFTVESFGEDSVAVRHIPSEIDISDTESVLSDLCMQLKQGGTAEPEQRDRIFKTIACKAAIKAGRSSDIHELESLASKVMSGEVSQCPHGRPVIFEITKSTLDKGFGRV